MVRVKKTPKVAERQCRVKKLKEKRRMKIGKKFHLKHLENQLEKLESLFNKQIK